MAADATVTLTVENMTCATCPITVRMAIKAVPGERR
jgi:copper chaperone CopZ